MPSRFRLFAKLIVAVPRLRFHFLLIAGILIATKLSSSTVAASDDKKAVEATKGEEQKPANAKDAAARKAQMAAMRHVGTGVTVSFSEDGQRDLEVIPEALFRSQDAAREEFDGTIWGYGKTGRPAALLTLALQPVGEGTYKWLFELNSLASRPVTARIPGVPFNWSTRKPGVEMKDIPDGPTVAEKEVGRTRQLRDLSTRFTGYEMLSKGANGPLERFELRLIPRPIHRYSDPERGLIDGAIFLMTHSTNPEIIMLIELIRENDESRWKVGFARCAWAELHVEFDGKEVWTLPHLSGTSSTDPYWLFTKGIAAGELDLE
jgi:hypothetical protein